MIQVDIGCILGAQSQIKLLAFVKTVHLLIGLFAKYKTPRYPAYVQLLLSVVNCFSFTNTLTLSASFLPKTLWTGEL